MSADGYAFIASRLDVNDWHVLGNYDLLFAAFVSHCHHPLARTHELANRAVGHRAVRSIPRIASLARTSHPWIEHGNLQRSGAAVLLGNGLGADKTLRLDLG